MKQTICVITGTRAEYGLLYWILKILNQDQDVQLQIIATGMHLSPEFGQTYQLIEEDQFHINKKVEMLLSSDSEVGIIKSMGLAQVSFAEALEELKPDVIIVLGDRFEIFAAVAAALVLKIPVAHLRGGETTEGAIDESFRHAITKMSHLHFTATEEYRKRVIQMGESPEKVFTVGDPGLDNIFNLQLLSREEFENSINFKLNRRNVLITFHPVTLENNTSERQFKELLGAIDGLEETNFIFTMPNSDTHGRIIIDLINDFVAKNPNRAKAYVSLGQLRYLSAIKYVDVVLGNSSSGLSEVPSFRKATVDIGDRQRGRIKAESVIECEPERDSISSALRMAFSEEFNKKLVNVKNPYGEGGASQKIVEIIKNFDYDNIIKKKFYNINFTL